MMRPDLKIDGAKRRFEANGYGRRQENTLGSGAARPPIWRLVAF